MLLQMFKYVLSEYAIYLYINFLCHKRILSQQKHVDARQRKSFQVQKIAQNVFQPNITQPLTVSRK